MCGPLALAVHSGKRVTGFFAVLDTLQYNSGRTLGYIALGIIAGLLGSFANIGDGQRVVSVMIGLSLVFLFLFSINPDQLINKIPSFKNNLMRFDKITNDGSISESDKSKSLSKKAHRF